VSSRPLFAVVLSALAISGLGACGSDDSGSKKTAKADKVQATGGGKPTGPITMCIGKDTSGLHGKLMKMFNQENPGAKAKLIELPESADEQRTQMVQRLRAKSSECDLLALDVIWTAEFAAQGWLKDVTDLINKRQDEFIASTLGTTKYEDKYWAFPYNSNAGLLFYRTDKVKQVPDTWQGVYDEAKNKGGIVYQGARYEGLTVNFLELLYAAGGKVLSDDGKESEIGSGPAAEVLKFMADGIKNGAAPKAVTTYKEEESKRAFDRGGPAFMRQWPYAYAPGQMEKVKGKFDAVPFPKYGDGEPASILGGYNLAINAYTKHEKAAVALINFLTGKKAQIESGKLATPPVTTEAYSDPGVKKGIPGSDILEKAIEQGKARPVSPVYPQISEAIYKNAHDALTGKKSPEAAAKAMDDGVKKALQTF
jgi:multiple sugar transport system substrate-binding protein